MSHKLTYLVISLTHRCNSRCQACLEWQMPAPDKNRELSAGQYRQVFQSWKDTIPYLSFVGGEAFLREDLAEIVITAAKNLHPKNINLATNGLLPEKIVSDTKTILSKIPFSTILTINLSIDGVRHVHDFSRGEKGFFAKLFSTYHGLKPLQKDFPNLRIAFHSGLSVYNNTRLPALFRLLESLKPDSYILEPAADRDELLEKMRKVQIDATSWQNIIQKHKKALWDLNGKVSLPYHLARFGYYPFSAEVLKKFDQVIPCQAGRKALFIDQAGNVKACENRPTIAGLPQFKYNLKKIFHSNTTKAEQQKIAVRECFCHSSYHYYISIESRPWYLVKLLLKMLMDR